MNVPDFWLAPPPILSKNVGLNRFIWDLRYPDPEQLLYTYYGIHVELFRIHACRSRHSAQYAVARAAGADGVARAIRSAVDGRRSDAPAADHGKARPAPESDSTQELQHQLELAQKIAALMNTTYDNYTDAAKMLSEVEQRVAALKQEDAATAAKAVQAKVQALTDPAGGFGPMNRDLTRLMIAVDQSDTAPASEIVETFMGMCQEAHDVLARWNELRSTDVPKLNALLSQQSQSPLTIPGRSLAEVNCGVQQ